MKVINNTVRSWLLENHYDDIAKLIDEIIEEWKVQGNKQRRNWWDILAGDKMGNPRVIANRTFPVLRAAQIRQNKGVTKNAIYKKGETLPY